ncbi:MULTISPECIES: DUF1045 domain-containing protein [unclassified Paludibacterium]|uniref:DUF1045 domain-containing protein n=1 Tax=unclassified Paludibacterium TaxID=2618429 RepID=UPI001C03EC51|nr:DUF1045 domain-containing protein [Paludibacterium sp. B53371]BEV71653.1 DUF1045 domain-containing protein [Paludibacterium sp. THUN1379]
MRCAIFYAPPPDSAFWQAGSQWLGYDAASGRVVTQPALPGLSHALTATAARYGWHGTLKAPFAPAPGVDEATLVAAVSELATRFSPFALPLQVGWLHGFLSLRPAQPLPRLGELATACVLQLQSLGDPQARLAERQGLSARQLELYARWGYPYVFEQFRFHMTLSERMAQDAPDASALQASAGQYFAPHLQQVVAGLALFVEPGAGQALRYRAYCGFDGEVWRDVD